jgi:phenylacetate-CoA ligase
MLGHLALLKEKGEGKNISPKIIASTGAPLNKPLKSLIESTFNAYVFESYASTESGPIAFQCKNGIYHVLSDFVHLEILKNNENVKSGETGRLILTKLYGKGTPIIRYNAINDIVSASNEKCNCGMIGDNIGKIYGRDDLGLYLPNGRVLLPSGFSDIFGQILYGLRTNKIKDTMIIQHDLKNVEIQVVIDEKSYNKKPSNEKIFTILKNGFQEKVGPDVNFTVKEMKKIERKGARIQSKVDRSNYKIIEYI